MPGRSSPAELVAQWRGRAQEAPAGQEELRAAGDAIWAMAALFAKSGGQETAAEVRHAAAVALMEIFGTYATQAGRLPGPPRSPLPSPGGESPVSGGPTPAGVHAYRRA